ncbi:unnamed protein product [Lampetra planeri]
MRSGCRKSQEEDEEEDTVEVGEWRNINANFASNGVVRVLFICVLDTMLLAGGSGSPLGDGVDMFRRRRDAFRVQSARRNEADAVVGCTSNSGVVLKKIRSLDAFSAVLPNLPAPGISARRAAPAKLPGLDVRAGAAATHLRESKGVRGLVKWRSCDSGVEMAHVESLPPSPLVPGAPAGWSGGRSDGSSGVSDETEPETEPDAAFRSVAVVTAPAAVSRRSARSPALHDDGRRTTPPDVATGAGEGGGARDHLGGRLDRGARGRSLSDETGGSSGMSSSTDVSLAWGTERGNASSHDDLNSVESWEEYINNHTQLNQMRCEGEMTPGSGLCHLDQLCRLMEKMGHLKEANKKLQQQSQQLQAQLQAQRLQEAGLQPDCSPTRQGHSSSPTQKLQPRGPDTDCFPRQPGNPAGFNGTGAPADQGDSPGIGLR